MSNSLAVKKPRNALIDVFKLVCTILPCMAHFNTYFYTAGGFAEASRFPATTNPEYQFSLIFQRGNQIWGMTGYVVISFFTFMTCYWLMDAFQKNKAKGVHGKGKDGTVIFRYWANNYAKYMPYIFLGIFLSITLTHLLVPQLRFRDIYGYISNLLTAIPQLFGFYGAGFDVNGFTYLLTGEMAAATNGFATSTADCMVTWYSSLWYMTGIICWCAIIYFIFLKSEIVGVGLVCPVLMMLFYGAYSTPAGFHFFQQWGIDNIPIRLFGEGAFGIWGWYVVRGLKKHDFTKKETVGLGIVSALSLAGFIFNIITAVGGSIVSDFTIAIFMVTVLAGKDPVSTALNKLCTHIPGVKHFGWMALCIYITHLSIYTVMGYCITLPEYAGLRAFLEPYSIDVQFLFALIVDFLVCIPYYFLDKYCLKKVTKWIIKVTKANEPVVFEEPVSAEVAK